MRGEVEILRLFFRLVLVYSNKLIIFDTIMNKIVTSHEYPPIPIRDYDWSAIRESYDEGDLIGYGKTEQEAIDDLVCQENER